MAISNSTTLNDLVGQIVAEQAQSAAYAARVMRPLVRSHDLPPGAGSIVVPRFQSLSVAALTEGTAPSSTTWSTDGVTLTPVERGVYVQVSKRALFADPFSDLAPYGEQIGRALASDEDALILDAVDPANNVNDQATPSNVTLADHLSGMGVLEAQNAPGPFAAVYHPTSWAKIRADLDSSNVVAFNAPGAQLANGFGEGQTSMNGFVGAPYGVPCFISTNVNTIDTAATYQNLMFAKEAIGYAFMQDIGVDVDDNVTARAFDLMGWYSGDADELVDLWAVAVEDDVDG